MPWCLPTSHPPIPYSHSLHLYAFLSTLSSPHTHCQGNKTHTYTNVLTCQIPFGLNDTATYLLVIDKDATLQIDPFSCEISCYAVTLCNSVTWFSWWSWVGRRVSFLRFSPELKSCYSFFFFFWHPFTCPCSWFPRLAPWFKIPLLHSLS